VTLIIAAHGGRKESGLLLDSSVCQRMALFLHVSHPV
jgi:hypothetical protein